MLGLPLHEATRYEKPLVGLTKPKERKEDQ